MKLTLLIFFVSILIFILSCKNFISIPNISYEISLLIDLFKEHNLIEDVIYGNFVLFILIWRLPRFYRIFKFTGTKDSEELIFGRLQLWLLGGNTN